jgi:YidC/Oxa1 family membrane protein insertase
MDRKSILVLLIAGGLFASWMLIIQKLFPPQTIPVTNAIAFATNVVLAGSNPPPVRAPSLATAELEAGLVRPTGPEDLVTLENDDARYTFTTHGGGLKLIELKKYPETVPRHTRRPGQTNELASLNSDAPVPAFTFVGSDALQGDGVFRLSRTATGVRAEKSLPNGVRLVKEFVPGSNYLLNVSVRLENATNQAVKLPVQEWVVGTATPINPQDNGRLMGLLYYDGVKSTLIGDPYFANRTMGCFPGTPRFIYEASHTNLLWAAVNNQFFTLVAMPASNALAPGLVARKIDLPPPSDAERAADRTVVAQPFGFQTALLYPGLELAPGQARERRYEVFAGPKEYRLLDHLAAQLGNKVDLVMNFGFFGFFAKALLLSMNGLHSLFSLSYGLCIVVITVIIKAVFWPLTQISTRSMKRMATLQPQMKALQEKYKDDPMKMQKKLQEFYREHKVNPAAGCLPIMIQLPIFFGFYTMLQSAIELRGAGFLWAFDLSQPDTVAMLPFFGGIPVNPLPLIMGATQLWQMRLTPPSPGVDPVQQKIMQYMPLMFLFILYNFSSGLTLYWTVQNLLSIAQMKLTRSTERPGAKAPPLPASKAPPAKKKA